MRIGKAMNWLAVRAYIRSAKLVQAPHIFMEKTPRFLSDETTRQPNGDLYAIVVKYNKFGVTPDFLHLLNELRHQNINPIVVCNGRLSQPEHDAIKAVAQRVLVRQNIGRDFGAYRAATLLLAAEGLQLRRLLYFNDSIMYVPGAGLRNMIASLADSEYDVVGTNENHEFIHHVGSYAFSVSGKVFNDAAVRRFWSRYRPYDIRPHAIRKGEVALSECFVRCGYNIDVLYSTDKLALKLDKMAMPDIVSNLRYLPNGAFRSYELEPLLAGAIYTGKMLSKRSGKRNAKPAAIDEMNLTPTISQYSKAMKGRVDTSPADDRGRLVGEQVRREVLVNHMMGIVMNGSQVHYGFGLFHRTMDSPLIKRDLLLRGLLFEHDCARILDYMPAQQREPIMRELLNRGRSVNVGGFRRFKLRNGLV
ncbi:lipopolysaccharide biosynthesis protein [Ochrobactrum sp. MH181795]|uniref:Lipopolysaccharide biosynthesis protein n=2 Tax=Brucella lupini TaxID=255457 RepID=A0AB34DNM4_9HYPH|nr:lipopolysaccharide biosynthesis protein [Brucella lupini]KAB2728035.1 lipopolysaccharide biosynthesis protein [Brucella anthropi]RNL44529.1 lipopolysaccharide biosynthesis protein [Ochrobactrum sp. MH181795]KAB2745207.1 lipopolysaccharide biosynthesis protein [Brucella anthropi]KAB2800041.1 lipopolysaccharide biosynthesis protein [Brucella anthropi]